MLLRSGKRARYEDLGAVGRALLPVYLGDRREPVVAALAAYFDESHNRDRGIYVVAGYVGHVSAFDGDLGPAWSSALARAPRRIEQFREFKASDLSHCKGRFEDWDRKAEAMPFYEGTVSTLSGVLRRSPIFGVAAATVYPKNIRHDAVSFEDPGFDLSGYDCCLGFALRSVLEMAGTLFRVHPDDREKTLEIIYDRRKEPLFKAAIKRRFDYTAAHARLPEGVSVEDPIPRDSDKVEALQAADLLAFETHMEVRSRMEDGQRPVRKSLEVMVSAGLHIATCIDIETLARMNIAGVGPEVLNAPTLFRSGELWRLDSHWRPGHRALSEDSDRLLTALGARRLALRLGLLPE